MEKLELKHLAPYFPYGLKCEILDYKCDYVGDKYDTIKGYYFYGDSPYFNFKHGRDHAGKNTTNFKPILRPLIDLTKEIQIAEFYSSFLTHIRRITGFEVDIDLDIDSGFLNSSYIEFKDYNLMLEFLYSYHFDVFGLIPKGQAIDINTL